MLNNIEIKNFGPLNDIVWNNLSGINLVIGANDSGKTFLLKTLYSAMRTLEDYKRGDERKKVAEILAEKLYWTFQPEKIGDLVTKGTDNTPLSCNITFDHQKFCYEFGKNTSQRISSIENNVNPRSSNSIFFPAKEVLSLDSIILKSRERDKTFGFDDTYLDLARALRSSSKGNRLESEFAQVHQNIEKILGGKVEYDEASGRWQFKKGNQKFSIGVTAEGIKNIAILDNLLTARYLDKESIIFIDEPESALHPVAISQLLDIVALLSEYGIQFFLASHSYFVVKKLFLLAQGLSIPVISANQGEWQYADLKNEMPANPIIDESIRLYKEEVELALQ